MTLAGAVVAFLLVAGFLLLMTILFAAGRESNANQTGMARL